MPAKGLSRCIRALSGIFLHTKKGPDDRRRDVLHVAFLLNHKLCTAAGFEHVDPLLPTGCEDTLMIESPWRNERVLESFTVAIFVVDSDWRFSSMNTVAEEVLEQSSDELTGRVLWEAFPEFAGTVFEREYRRAVEETIGVQFEGFYGPLSLWVQVYAYPTADGLTVTFQDITERKTAKRDAERMEARNRAIVQALPDDVYLISKSGVIVEAERGGSTGTDSLGDILGRSVDDVFPPDIARRYHEAIQSVRSSGEMRLISYRLPESTDTIHAPTSHRRETRPSAPTEKQAQGGAPARGGDQRRDGTKSNTASSDVDAAATAMDADTADRQRGERMRMIEARVVPVEGNGVLAIVRDVTMQRGLERQVLQVTKRERERIGRDLHDGLASLLSGISMMAKTLERTVQKGGQASIELLSEIRRLAKDGVDQARALSQGLNPVDVAPDEFIEALREMAANAETVSGKRCYLDDPDEVEILKPEVATQLYWIAQEAVTNSVRHSDGDMIAVGVWHDSDDLMLSIRDDGVGLGKGEGMGQRTMRYRAQVIGATLEIRDRLRSNESGHPGREPTDAPSSGVEVVCRIPVWKAIQDGPASSP
jgi:PAS domain S-box-containing protein